MATKILEQETETVNWRRPHTSTRSANERLEILLMQVESLSALLYGAGGSAFRNYNDTIQDNVLWLLSDLLSEMRELWDERGSS